MSESPSESTGKRPIRRSRQSSSPNPRRSLSNRSASPNKRRSSSSNYSSSNHAGNANNATARADSGEKKRRRARHRSSSSGSSANAGRGARGRSRSGEGRRAGRARGGHGRQSRSPGERPPPRYARYSRAKPDGSGAEPCTCIGVFGLSKRTTEDTLWERFERYGRIDNVRLIMDRSRRESLGYAFVDYKELDSAKRAMKEAHGMDVDGNTIRLDYSVGKRPLGAPPGGGKYGARSNNGHRDWRPRSRSRSRSRSSRSSYGDRRRRRRSRSRSRSSRGSYRKSRRDRRSRSRSQSRSDRHRKRRRVSRSDSRHSSR